MRNIERSPPGSAPPSRDASTSPGGRTRGSPRFSSTASTTDILETASFVAPAHGMVQIPNSISSSLPPPRRHQGLSKKDFLAAKAKSRSAEDNAARATTRAAKAAQRIQPEKKPHANRVPHIPNPELAQIDDDKFDNYALNSKHPLGGPKSAVFASAGFPLVSEWVHRRPEFGRKAALANPNYLEGRELFKKQLTQNLATTSAEPKPTNEHRERYDTKHRIVNPQADNAKPVVTRAQWAYSIIDGKASNIPHLGTVQPSDESSEEER